MGMRAKRRARAMGTRAWADIDEVLLPIRRARVAMLRNPAALAEIQDLIRRCKGPGAKVMRAMLREDIRLMQRLDSL